MTTAVERMVADHCVPPGDACPSINLASTATAEVVAIPASWRGRFVVFTCSLDAAVRSGVRFGTANTVSVSLSATTTLVAGVPTQAGTEPMLVVAAGESRPMRLHYDWTHFAHVEGAAAGFFTATLVTSDGKTSPTL